MNFAWIKNATIYGKNYWLIGVLLGIFIIGFTLKFKKNVWIGITLTYFYLLVLFGYTVFGREYWSETAIKFIPFRSYIEMTHGNIKAFLGIAINIAIFIPVGFLTAFFIRYKGELRLLLKILIVSLIISLSIESLQIFRLIGYFEVDDLINNSFGGLIGALVCRMILKKKRKKYHNTKIK